MSCLHCSTLDHRELFQLISRSLWHTPLLWMVQNILWLFAFPFWYWKNCYVPCKLWYLSISWSLRLKEEQTPANAHLGNATPSPFSPGTLASLLVNWCSGCFPRGIRSANIGYKGPVRTSLSYEQKPVSAHDTGLLGCVGQLRHHAGDWGCHFPAQSMGTVIYIQDWYKILLTIQLQNCL